MYSIYQSSHPDQSSHHEAEEYSKTMLPIPSTRDTIYDTTRDVSLMYSVFQSSHPDDVWEEPQHISRSETSILSNPDMTMARDTRDVGRMYDTWMKSHHRNSEKEDSGSGPGLSSGESRRGSVSVARDPSRDVSAMYDVWQKQHQDSQSETRPEMYGDTVDGPGVVEGEFLEGVEMSRDVGRMYDLWESLHAMVQGREGKRDGRGELDFGVGRDLGFGERCGSGGGMGGGDWVVV